MRINLFHHSFIIYRLCDLINFWRNFIQVEELRRKYSARIQEQEEQIETLLVKINNLEKQKSRLQSEVEVLIIDLEKVRFPFEIHR